MNKNVQAVVHAISSRALRRELHRLYKTARTVITRDYFSSLKEVLRAAFPRAFLWHRGPRSHGSVTGRPLRVLMVTGSFPPAPCGVGDYTSLLANSLNELHRVSVRLLTSAGQPLPDDPVWVARKVPAWTEKHLEPYRRLLTTYEPDIVHLQYPTQG